MRTQAKRSPLEPQPAAYRRAGMLHARRHQTGKQEQVLIASAGSSHSEQVRLHHDFTSLPRANLLNSSISHRTHIHLTPISHLYHAERGDFYLKFHFTPNSHSSHHQFTTISYLYRAARGEFFKYLPCTELTFTPPQIHNDFITLPHRARRFF